MRGRGYAINAHLAHGLTSDCGISVMDSRERNLNDQKIFVVTVIRLCDHLTLFVDSTSLLGGAMSQNKGDKSSAPEVATRLGAEALARTAKELVAEALAGSREELQREKSRALDIGIWRQCDDCLS